MRSNSAQVASRLEHLTGRPVQHVIGDVRNTAQLSRTLLENEIDAVVQRFQAEFVAEGGADQAQGPAPQKAEVGGRLLRWFELGEGGTPLVLVHGFGGD